MTDQPKVKLDELEDALMFVSTGGMFDNAAWIRRATGEVLWHCDDVGDFEPVPEDIDVGDRYVALPDKHDLDLGKPLVLDFARAHLPEQFEQVQDIFSRSGAYARFKDLLDRHDRLDAWYQWEADKTRQALREWCEANDIQLAD